MAQLLVRNLDPQIVERLKNIAKSHHRSLQGEIKHILEYVASAPAGKLSFLEEETSSWPKGFLKEIFGGWQGESLTRPPQGDYEKRDELE